MNTTEITNKIAAQINDILPGCGIWFYRNTLTAGASNITVTVGQNTSEFTNGIRQNDPLSLSIWVWSENEIVMECGLSIKTEKPYRYRETVKLRKQSMKAYNPITVEKYLTKAKELILSNQNNWLDKDKELLTKRFCVSGELAV